ncbi:MAG: NAD-binding protein [Nanoarchaeota archaeon]|nr:NAD-binding protein [Nanoarchaeota archaeon]MBU4086499.1 NAD-binding protein [Nanoarchaeota archaeon]
MSRGTIVEVREFPKRVLVFLILLSSLLAVGTIGFKLSTGMSFQTSFIMTLETLAFMFHAESGFGKFLEIFLAIFGVFLVWWILWGTFDMLLEGNLGEYLKISKFLNRLKKMRGHYIIAGGGRVGEDIALHFCNNQKECIIVEKNEEVIKKLKRNKNFFVMHGDVTDESVLKKAKIQDAKAIILAMPETEKNLLVTMIAKEINPQIEIYARADKPAFVNKLKKAGAKVVIVPEIVAAEKFLQEINKQ